VGFDVQAAALALFMHMTALGSLPLKRHAGRATSRGRGLSCSIKMPLKRRNGGKENGIK